MNTHHPLAACSFALILSLPGFNVIAKEVPSPDGGTAAAIIPDQLPDPDMKEPARNKPVKVYILSGQSNMVGMGDIHAWADRWSSACQGTEASIYPGDYDPKADYDNMNPVVTKKLPNFGGRDATGLPSTNGANTLIVRATFSIENTGEFGFVAGPKSSTNCIIEINGKEAHRKEPGKAPVRTDFHVEANKEYAFKMTFLAGPRDSVGWYIRTDLPGMLETLVMKQGRFPHLWKDEGGWTVRNDVMYKAAGLEAPQELTVGLRDRSIGPELQFGHIMGYYHEEPVVLIKAAIGNRSLAWDILTPGSKRYTVDGKVYAGYKDPQPSWDEGTEPEPADWYAGKEYDTYTKDIHDVLKNFDTLFPQYKEQGYEIAGFLWWQGHKDGNEVHANRYEQNLVNLIKTWRKEFDAPKAPWVIGTVGFGGWQMKGHHLTIANAQLAVSGETGKYPEFKDNVLTIETRDFWRDAKVSPKDQDYHYNRNAETYMMVGDSMGRGMVKLTEKSKAK